MGSGRSSVGRAVGSNSRGPRFESSHQQNFIMSIFYVEKTKIKEKEVGTGPFSFKCGIGDYLYDCKSIL